jgi:spore coat polysaccharide biosynthesis protein SpsF (cytidylyltransferase family)
MRIGIFLTARLGSTRLPRKHLLEAGGKAMLAVLAGRIRHGFASALGRGDAVLAIVTSDEAANRDFERVAGEPIAVFYGSKQNIPLRHLQAARHFGVDAIVAVDGDDVLCSVDAMRVVANALAAGAEYTRTTGLPLGMNAFGYRTEFLARSVSGKEQKTLETGWTYIFDATRLTSNEIDVGLRVPEGLRFTLDYSEDYEFFRRIVEHFGAGMDTAGDKDIVSYVLAQGLQKITDPIAQKYWENFQSVRAEEMGRG